MYQANLSFDLLEKYLHMLLVCGMIESKEEDRFYVATPKGLQLLSDYQELVQHAGIAENKKRALEESLAQQLPSEAA
jgi:predicted transcriptional regulator